MRAAVLSSRSDSRGMDLPSVRRGTGGPVHRVLEMRHRPWYGSGMKLLLNCRDLTKAYGLRVLFKGITFGLHEGQRSGLIGPNGSGKSTLMRILAGLEVADSGELSTARGLRLGYVAQEDKLDAEQTVEQSLIAAIDDDHIDEHERH